MRMTLRILVVIIAVLAAGAVVWLLRPLNLDDLVSKSDPARSYDEAMERWERKQAVEADLPLHDGGRTIVLTHGYQTERVLFFSTD